MPELPEVEVTRRSFADAIQGATIAHLWMGKPLRWPLGCAPSMVAGRVITNVTRRGKYLLLHLNPGLLMVHLGMSGSLAFSPAGAARTALGTHDHFELHTSAGVLRLTDPRRFGAIVYADGLSDARAVKLLGHLGVEPLDDGFEVNEFVAAMRMRRAPIKQVLLAGDVVVGVGNIYASEALFLAGIRPTRAANRVAPARLRRLHAVIKQVLQQAVDLGGSTLKDFKNAQGEHGLFQTQSRVYDRAGEPCYVCQSPIKRMVQGQRATYYCASCQK
jgi:formamidopyrimidine-DNA glycosylase